MSHRRDWEHQRSEHARVLESLAGVIGPRPVPPTRPSRAADDAVVELPSNVVDLRARRALVASGARPPHDAA